MVNLHQYNEDDPLFSTPVHNDRYNQFRHRMMMTTETTSTRESSPPPAPRPNKRQRIRHLLSLPLDCYLMLPDLDRCSSSSSSSSSHEDEKPFRLQPRPMAPPPSVLLLSSTFPATTIDDSYPLKVMKRPRYDRGPNRASLPATFPQWRSDQRLQE